MNNNLFFNTILHGLVYQSRSCDSEFDWLNANQALVVCGSGKRADNKISVFVNLNGTFRSLK